MKNLRSSYIFSRVYTALAQREGKNVTLPTLVSMTGLEERQIQGTIANARRSSELHARQIQVVKTGRVWKLIADNDNRETVEQVAQEVEMGSHHIWKVVLAALVANADKISSKNLLAELASTPERPITPQQVASAMDTILRRPGISQHVEIKWARNAWMYVTPKQSKQKEPSEPKDYKPTSAPIRGSVLRYFTQHPGETLFRDDIAEDLGFTVKQVQSAMWSLLNENEGIKNDFETVQTSYAWRYVPNRSVNVSVAPKPETKPELNGHVTPELAQLPPQEYTPAAITTTLPVSSVVPNIPKAAPAPVAVATSGRLFEEIGQTSSGDLLVQESETKKVYRATEL